MNGKSLSDNDAKMWLLGRGDDDDKDNNGSSIHSNVNDADLVILSLQECPTYPGASVTSRKAEESLKADETQIVPCISVLGPPPEAEEEENDNDDRLPSTIQKILSDDHVRIADIAMGEKPGKIVVNKKDLLRNSAASSNSGSLENSDAKAGEEIVEKWYGFIRLMVYAKSGKLQLLLLYVHVSIIN